MASTDNEVGEDREEGEVDVRARPLTSCLRDIGCMCLEAQTQVDKETKEILRPSGTCDGDGRD